MLTLRRTRDDNKGQTLAIAIMVMFLLAMVAAVFIGIVARNLFRSQRFANVDAVAQIAEAGVRYADRMLTTSEDGADWRPKPENLGVIVDAAGVPVLGGDGKPQALISGGTPPLWQQQRDQNPDFQWTRAYWPEELQYCGPTGGYTKFDAGFAEQSGGVGNVSGGGRFLLRVSYNPSPNDPYSKYIKIESVGRSGVYDANDPTTWKPHGDVLMRREVTAYKPIGITDYVRFVTNKDNRSMDMPLGWADNTLTFGRSGTDSQFGARGGPIRVNGNLLWHGNVTINLRGTHPLLQDGTVDLSQYIPLDTVEVAGDVRMQGDTSSVTIRLLGSDGSVVDTIPTVPSNAPNFTSASGFYRDGSDLTDKDQAARGVKRIEPPLIDQPDPTGTTTRYRLLTLNSGERIRNLNNTWFNLGQYGWGRGVYIGNTRDRQAESETLIGGYTLQSDWLKPNSPMSTYWKGPYYEPPGAIIILHSNDTDMDGQPDFTIIRSDTQADGRKWVWYDAWGNPHREWGGSITMPYPDAKRGRVVYDRDSNGNILKGVSKTLDGNGVIYAEGNIRIRGMLPKDTQLTVVSNENIYIEGNLLKYRDPSTPVSGPYLGTSETGTCGLALLARQNICVNTTQFIMPQMGISAEDVGSDARNGQPPYHLIVSSSPDSRIKCAFDFGPWESDSTSATPTEWGLFLRHAGDYGPTYINAWLNPGGGSSGGGLLNLNTGYPNLPSYVWGVGDPNFSAPGSGIGSSFVCDAFSLVTTSPGNLTTAPGMVDVVQIALDQTTYTRSNYLMGGLAIQPMDIRIEAVCYAQEGSFFVIPGNWFNPNPDDAVPADPSMTTGASRPPGVAGKFPFFGDPLDVRIIIDGAVSENIPAPMGAVNDWMSKWSAIPEYYGSSSVKTAHHNEGLTILYDDHAGWPYSDLGIAAAPVKPIRTDKFGRSLPIAPRLPVSGSLIYFGDVM